MLEEVEFLTYENAIPDRNLNPEILNEKHREATTTPRRLVNYSIIC